MTAPAWWDRLPPNDHPLWKILQAVVAIGGIVVMASHGSTHVQDGAGAVGAGIGGWLLRSLLSGGKET